MAEQTKALHGRIPNRTILAAHHICMEIGVEPKSHFHAIRFALEVMAYTLQPDIMKKEWSPELEAELNQRGQQKISTNISGLELEAAMQAYQGRLKAAAKEGIVHDDTDE